MTRLMVTLFGIVLAGAMASAHHGYSAFFNPAEQTAQVEGVVERVSYANPHVRLWLRMADGKLVTVTWSSARQLALTNWWGVNQPVTADTFKRGDRLVVVGAAPRDADRGEIALVQEVRRQRDGWIWRNPSRFTQPD